MEERKEEESGEGADQKAEEGAPADAAAEKPHA